SVGSAIAAAEPNPLPSGDFVASRGLPADAGRLSLPAFAAFIHTPLQRGVFVLGVLPKVWSPAFKRRDQIIKSFSRSFLKGWKLAAATHHHPITSSSNARHRPPSAPSSFGIFPSSSSSAASGKICSASC